MDQQEKTQLLKQLWNDLASDTTATTNIKIRKGKKVNVGFVNQYSKHDFIPNKWFDWENRANAKIMIIGQDWGPYSALLPYVTKYETVKNDPKFDYNAYLFQTFSSRTEKFIMKAIEKTYQDKFQTQLAQSIWDDFIFTVAVMFTRQGKHFRGNEFYDEKFGTKISYPYLIRQIEIIKPKIIMPLGGTAYSMLREYFYLNNYGKTISNVISELGDSVIKTQDTIVIPNFHPASHTDPKIQMAIWSKIWENL